MSEENNIDSIKDEKKFDETDFKRANIIINAFKKRVEEIAPVRFGSSRDEKNSALKIRELYHKTLGLQSRLEPFTVRPLAGRFGIPVLGGAYAIALFMYILGLLVPLRGHKVFLGLSMIILVVVAILAYVQVFQNKNTFNKLFPKKTSYNVITDFDARGETDYTFIIGGHYDSDMDRADAFLFLRDKNLPHIIVKLLKIFTILSIPTLFIFNFVCLFLPEVSVGVRAVLLILPVIFSGIAIFYTVTYFSYYSRHSKKGRAGLTASGMALAVTDYLREHTECIPDNCRLVLASFGSKECGAKGSEQFIKEHWGRDNTLINPYFVNISEVKKKGYKVIFGESQRKFAYDRNLSNVIFNSFKNDGLNPVYENNKVMFTDSAPFALNKIPTTTMQLNSEHTGEELTFDESFKAATNATIAALKYVAEHRNRAKSIEEEEKKTLEKINPTK